MALKIELVTPGPDFSISADAVMPVIKVKLVGPELSASGPAGRPPAVVCDWAVKLALNCSEVPYGPGRTISHPDITARTSTPELTIPFTRVRGGKLAIKVTCTVGTQTLTASVESVGEKPIRVLGTNPSLTQLHMAIPSKALRLVVQAESSCRQFDVGMPLFSRDHLGGVGLLQITRPAPSDDDVWDWRANVRSAIALFDEKLAAARAFPRQVRASRMFAQLAARLNTEREKAGKKALKLNLPDFTEEQVDRDAVRGYNGYGGDDFFLGPRHLHEYRVKLNTAVGTDIKFAVKEDPAGVTGSLEWEVPPEGLRPPGRGGYVNRVFSRGDF